MELFFCVFVQMQSRYKESWNKVRDGGYKLRLDAISFQSAKASGDILSDVSLSVQTAGLWSPCIWSKYEVALIKAYGTLTISDFSMVSCSHNNCYQHIETYFRNLLSFNFGHLYQLYETYKLLDTVAQFLEE